MTAGIQYNADSINSQAAQAVIGVRNALAYAYQQYAWLNQLGTAGIEAAPAVGNGTQINATDAANILAALTDLAGLDQFFLGETATLGFGAAKITGTYNFMSFGQLLTGGQLSPAGKHVPEPGRSLAPGCLPQLHRRLPHLVRRVGGVVGQVTHGAG